MGISGPEYWNGWPFPSSGDLPDPGIEPGSPALQADSLPPEPPGQSYWRCNDLEGGAWTILWDCVFLHFLLSIQIIMLCLRCRHCLPIDQNYFYRTWTWFYNFPVNESTLHMRWPKYWNFSLSISPSNEYPGLVSFRKDWLDLLAVQGTLKSLLQHHSSKASIFQRSAFFTVQLSPPYMTTGKTIVLTRWIFVGKVMSLFLICYLGWSYISFQGVSVF